MQCASFVRRFSFFLSVACSIALFICINVLTEQMPAQTTSLSTAAYERLTGNSETALSGDRHDAAGANEVLSEGISAKAFDSLFHVAGIRKWAHTAEFFFFAFPVASAALLWWGRPYPRLSRFTLCLGICVLASLFDQFHKLFVPGREFDVTDLKFDALGYVSAAVIAFAMHLWISNRLQGGGRPSGGE